MAEDIDVICSTLRRFAVDAASASGCPPAPVIFNCQIGVGRSTTGMVLATLMLRTGGVNGYASGGSAGWGTNGSEGAAWGGAGTDGMYSGLYKGPSVRLTDEEMRSLIDHELNGNSPRSEMSEVSENEGDGAGRGLKSARDQEEEADKRRIRVRFVCLATRCRFKLRLSTCSSFQLLEVPALQLNARFAMARYCCCTVRQCALLPFSCFWLSLPPSPPQLNPTPRTQIVAYAYALCSLPLPPADAGGRRRGRRGAA